MNRDKVVVYFYGAFVPEVDGCHARTCALLDRLVANFANVAVFSYDNHPDFPWTLANKAAFAARWPGVELILDRYTRRLRQLTRVKNLLISIYPRAATRLLRQSFAGWSPGYERLRAQARAVFVTYTHGLAQLNGVDPDLCIVDTHDINFAKWAKLNHASPVSVASLRKLRGEVATLRVSRAVVAISPPEAAFFRMMLGHDGVFYVASWDVPRAPIGGTERASDYDLVFVGSGYAMNARGLCELLGQHGAWLSRYRIAVCGRVCDSPDVQRAVRGHPNVCLLGYVDRPADIYARSRAALSPVDGTGLKMKILAAMEHGRPVFASRHSLDGLPPGYDGAVFPIDEAMVAEVLDTEYRWQAACRAARNYRATIGRTGDAGAVLDRVSAMTR